MKMRKIAAMGLSAVMAASMVPALPVMADDAAGKVYYLNFKPEQDEAWQNLAAKYTEETGVPVTVVTAASGQYETTLQSEMAKSDAPTLFQVNGPVGLKNWKDYCYDLSGSDIYSQLTSDAYTVKDGDAVDGIAYVIESYGLIVNKTLLEKAGYTVDDIKSFDDLKKVADDIQARKDELGVKGAFTSAGMDGSSDWRFKHTLQTFQSTMSIRQMASMIQMQSREHTLITIRTYLIFILQILPAMEQSFLLRQQMTPVTSSSTEMQYSIRMVPGNMANCPKTYSDDELAMIPIYFGVDDENEGLATGTENFWCVNKEASEEDIQATLDFMNWCVTSEDGTKAMSEDMGFTIPFKTAEEPTNVFVKQDAEYTAAGLTPVSWNFTTMPSEEWKNGLGTALTLYAAGSGSWDDVVSAFVDNWATEKALSE